MPKINEETNKIIGAKLEELLGKDFGRLVIEKHQNKLHIEVTSKTQLKI